MERTQEDKVVSGLIHLSYLLGWLGGVAALVVFLVYRDKSKFVADHAKQALALQVVRIAIGVVLGLFVGGSMLIGGFAHGPMYMPDVFGGFFGLGALRLIVTTVMLAFAIIGSVNAFQGKEYRYPVIGDAVARMGE